MLSSNCATSVINRPIPMRVAQTSATILDHIITNENRHEILLVVICYAITDHYLMMAIIGKTFTTKNAPPNFAKSFSHFNQDDFNNDLLLELNQFFQAFIPLPKAISIINLMNFIPC